MPYHSSMDKNRPSGMKPKELSQKTMDKLKEHAKQHKGAMRSKHMKDMIKHMKDGKTFSQAHSMALGKDVKGKTFKGEKMEVNLGGKKPVKFVKGSLRKELGLTDKSPPLALNELQRLKKVQVGKDFNFRGKKIMMNEKMKKRVILGINLMMSGN